MPVSVKEYLDSMNSISSSIRKKPAGNEDVKTQLLLSQLIEAISYSKSIDFRKKTLNRQASGTANDGETGKMVLENIQAQEKLIRQLADGQKLTEQQNKELTAAIDKFYELAGSSEINYKKFAESLEKFALQDLPEAVQTRLINDSRDAHMIGQEQKRHSGPVLKILKKIQYMLEDSAENTKQFTKKLFVTLDEFREDFLNKLEGLFEDGPAGFLERIADLLNGVGMAFMLFQGMFKEGNFKWGQLFKQIDNMRTMFKAFKEVGGIGAGIDKSIKSVKAMFSGIKMIGRQFKFLPKLIEKFGLGKGLGAAAKGIGKGLAKGLGKQTLKKIPLIGTLFSIWMGIERWKQGDKLGAFLEFGSGVAAMFPGVGTLVSIGLDLINLERDTKLLSKGSKRMMSKMTPLGENLLMSIPLIGPIYGIMKAIGLFKQGDKRNGLIMIGKSIASIIPGGAFIADMLVNMLNLNDHVQPSPQTSTSNSSRRRFRWPWQRGGTEEYGDGNPIMSPLNQLGGDSGGKTVQFGPKLAREAARVAHSSSTGKCGLYVGNAVSRTLGEGVASKLRGNGNQWANSLKSPTGRKYFDYRGTENNLRNLRNLPAGSILSWPAAGRHRYGHVEIADGRGNLISDFKRPSGQIYRDTPYLRPSVFTPKGVDSSSYLAGLDSRANTSPNEGVASEYSEDTEPELAFNDYSDVGKFFEEFNKQFESNIVKGTAKQYSNGLPVPSAESIASGTPAANTAAATAVTAERASSMSSANRQAPPPPPATVTSAPSGPTDTMDTEIRDTDLTLLNSILFT